MLDDLLEYHESPEDSAFVTQVMNRVNHQQKLRRLILFGTGTIGALFGAVGAVTLSEPLAQTLANSNLLPASVAMVGVVALLAWVFQDETTASG